MTAATTTPRHSTNARNGTSSASAMPATVFRRRARRAHAEHDRAGQRGPCGRQSEQRRDGEPDQRQCQHDEHEYRHLHIVGGRSSCCGSTARSRAKSQRSNTNSTPTAASHGSVITAVKWTKRQPRCAERQQVGQVGHRKQQRGTVGEVRGGVGVRPGRDPQRAGGREHHRGQQHHGRIQAQDRRGGRRDHEHRCKQALLVARARPGHGRASGAEQALVVAQPGQHEHRGEEPDDRQQPAHLGGGLVPGDHAECDQQAGRGHRGDGLGPAARADHRESEHHGQRDQRQRQLHGSQRCHSVGRCSGTPSSSASRGQHPHRHVEIVAGVRQRAQRLGAAGGRSRPSG